jgi:hypothetical protein
MGPLPVSSQRRVIGETSSGSARFGRADIGGDFAAGRSIQEGRRVKALCWGPVLGFVLVGAANCGIVYRFCNNVR